MSERAPTLAVAVRQPEGAERTAALAAWFQGLFEAVGEPPPVLVGGAAVEIYTGGAYVSGDLDFVGALPDRVADELGSAGFRREGRHWVHPEEEIFIELPATSLGEGERAVKLRQGELEVLAVDLEALVVDRLAAWEFWKSTIDGVAALQLIRIHWESLDRSRLDRLAEAREVTLALERAESFFERLPSPTEEEILTWASRTG